MRGLPKRFAGAVVFSLCIAAKTLFAATPDYLTYDQPGTQLEDPLEEGLWTESKPEKAAILPRLEDMSPFWRNTRLPLRSQMPYATPTYHNLSHRPSCQGSWFQSRHGWDTSSRRHCTVEEVSMQRQILLDLKSIVAQVRQSALISSLQGVGRSYDF